MQFRADSDNITAIDNTLGKPEVVYGRYHFPLVNTDYYRASKLRVKIGNQHRAFVNVWNYGRIINQIYESGNNIFFRRANGDIAFILTPAGED